MAIWVLARVLGSSQIDDFGSKLELDFGSHAQMGLFGFFLELRFWPLMAMEVLELRSGFLHFNGGTQVGLGFGFQEWFGAYMELGFCWVFL